MGIYDACWVDMMWMKCLLFFGVLFDVCMSQINLDTTSTLRLWYKFDSPDGIVNSGTVGSNDLVEFIHSRVKTSYVNPQVPFLTSTNAKQGNTAHILSKQRYDTKTFPADNWGNSPVPFKQVTFAFWLYIPTESASFLSTSTGDV